MTADERKQASRRVPDRQHTTTRGRTRSMIRSTCSLCRWLLPAPAVAFTFTLFVVHAAVLWVAIWRHLAADAIGSVRAGYGLPSTKETWYSFIPDFTIDVPRRLWWLIPDADLSIAFARYPQGEITHPLYIGVQIALSLALVVAGVLVGRSVCGALAVRAMDHDATNDQRRTRRRRTARLAHRRVPMRFWVFTAAVGAACVSLLGDATAIWYGQFYFENRFRLNTNFTWINHYLSRDIGLLSWYDFPLFALWAFLAPFLIMVLPARAGIRSRARSSGARCVHCRYPRPREHRGADNPCTECGKPPPPQPPPLSRSSGASPYKPHRSRRRIAWALFALFVVSLVVFTFTPHAVNARLKYVTTQGQQPPSNAANP